MKSRNIASNWKTGLISSMKPPGNGLDEGRMMKRLNDHNCKSLDPSIAQGNHNRLQMGSIHELRILTTAIILSLVAFLVCGCSGEYIEYATLDSSIVGKVIHFKEPMVYLVFDDKRIAQKYGFIFARFKNRLIRRELDSLFSAKELRRHYLADLKTQFIKENMSFVILGSYWERGGWLTREFAPDVQFIILKDEHNILSSYMVAGDNIQDSLSWETDFRDD